MKTKILTLGAADTAQFLLDLGAPAGVCDSDGNPAICHLLEKTPHVAYKALDQFIVYQRSFNRDEMYLYQLENRNPNTQIIVKSPLEVRKSEKSKINKKKKQIIFLVYRILFILLP